jgi:serine/threonine protein kinase
LIEVKEADKIYFIFMKLCEGTTLLDILNKFSPLSEECENIFSKKLFQP